MDLAGINSLGSVESWDLEDQMFDGRNICRTSDTRCFYRWVCGIAIDAASLDGQAVDLNAARALRHRLRDPGPAPPPSVHRPSTSAVRRLDTLQISRQLTETNHPPFRYLALLQVLQPPAMIPV